MNKKQKILTVIALAVFAGIIAEHYSSGEYGLIPDVRLPIFVLAVFYARLFFLFGGKDTDSVPRRPRDWRRIKIIDLILAGLVLIAGLIAAIINFQATRQANIEEEASKHRIKSSEIGLKDLKLD